MSNKQDKKEVSSVLEILFSIALTSTIVTLGMALLFGFFDK
jgi:hypothetical protein